MDPIGLIFLALIFGVAVTASAGGMLRLQVLLLVLKGTTAMSFGPTITVPYACLPLLVLHAFWERRRQRYPWRISWPAIWLALVVIWGAALAVLAPRMFAGQVEVFQNAVDPITGRSGTILRSVRPSSSNLTQTAYAFGNFATFVAARFLLRQLERVRVFRRSVVLLSALVVGTGLLDIVEFYTGMPSLLDVFRTAYVAHDQSMLGMPRIAGTFPETSVFSGFAVMLFAFNAQLSLDDAHPWLPTTLAALLLVLLVLTTSATAYGSLALYSGFFLFSLLQRARKGKATSRLGWLLATSSLVVATAGVLLTIESPLTERAQALFQSSVLEKAASDSGEVRGAWTAQALRNFVDTWGLGLGVGSNVVNSFLAALLSNLGVVGVVGYALFLGSVLRPAPSHQLPEVATTARASAHALVAGLLAASLSATSFALGIRVYLFAAMSSLATRPYQDAEPD